MASMLEYTTRMKWLAPLLMAAFVTVFKPTSKTSNVTMAAVTLAPICDALPQLAEQFVIWGGFASPVRF